MHMSFKGLSCWIELKVDEGSGTFLRPEQLAFATMTARNEGHYFVVSHLFADEAVGVWHFPFDHIFDETKKLYLITAYPQFLTEKRQQRKILDFIYEFKSPAITQERHTNA